MMSLSVMGLVNKAGKITQNPGKEQMEEFEF